MAEELRWDEKSLRVWAMTGSRLRKRKGGPQADAAADSSEVRIGRVRPPMSSVWGWFRVAGLFG